METKCGRLPLGALVGRIARSLARLLLLFQWNELATMNPPALSRQSLFLSLSLCVLFRKSATSWSNCTIGHHVYRAHTGECNATTHTPHKVLLFSSLTSLHFFFLFVLFALCVLSFEVVGCCCSSNRTTCTNTHTHIVGQKNEPHLLLLVCLSVCWLLARQVRKPERKKERNFLPSSERLSLNSLNLHHRQKNSLSSLS